MCKHYAVCTDANTEEGGFRVTFQLLDVERYVCRVAAQKLNHIVHALLCVVLEFAEVAVGTD